MRAFQKYLIALLLLLSPLLVASSSEMNSEPCNRQDRENHPVLCMYMDRFLSDPVALSQDIYEWAQSQGLIIDFSDDDKATLVAAERRLGEPEAPQLPVVFAHGMGDSCFNGGMQHITDHVSSLLNCYATCIPTGKTQSEDTSNGYFLNMDASVDVFSESIRADPKLANGFHAIGFSQGNNIIRGYIARYNDPPVNTFISVNGVNAGVGAVPYCRPKLTNVGFSMCDLLMEQASRRAYTTYAQEHLFQANYWRDPRPVEADAYKTYAQLAQWNNEGFNFNQTLNDNYAMTEKYVWVMAEQDTMVWPKEGEHWGAPDPNDPFHTILPMNETEWYLKDLFGLRTAQEAGKNNFESFDGDHLQFTMDEFDGWVNKYLS